MIFNFHGYMCTVPHNCQGKTKTARQKQIPTAKPKPFCFCCEVFGFAVRFLVSVAVKYFVFAVRFLVLP